LGLRFEKDQPTASWLIAGKARGREARHLLFKDHPSLRWVGLCRPIG